MGIILVSMCVCVLFLGFMFLTKKPVQKKREKHIRILKRGLYRFVPILPASESKTKATKIMTKDQMFDA